jgi:hypothetical protein
MVRTEADELKELKYGEIRDAELDHASGKLSDQDYAILDAELRKEAVEILDTVGVGAGTAAPRPGRAGLPSDYVGGEGNGNGHSNGNGGGVALEERPTNGSGATNGHANGSTNGHTNGHANGATNGHANGSKNGHTNGHANGHSKGSGNGNGSIDDPAERD